MSNIDWGKLGRPSLEASVINKHRYCAENLATAEERIANLETEREAMRAVLQSYTSLLETIKSSRKGYVGDHTIYSVQLNESAVDSLYVQVKEVYEEHNEPTDTD